eukprot:CAMPEP_0206618776 /NCGR_PEP_ID=MMETSP0325_2-20121206/60462_1 /ASSEMBLY_ACC=CAM_ASM_000347 /TAXON_ID=2866 /ORGANISM="Crypthecodinium cohnii, Strain Seligo" /LENGTH=275 /DNA_ID=CAMNT_0054141075 /DNA_START=295 /DNA_END=1122 /DNA_ORIENTATION=-
MVVPPPAAGCPTRIQDPLWKATPSSSSARPLPNGNFPSGVTFRLPTPERVGVGVMCNEFKPPEQESWHRAAGENGQRFARSHQYFDHYDHMQRKAALLVPVLDRHSRISDMNRVWEQRKAEEADRHGRLQAIDKLERKRLDWLRDTKSIMRRPVISQAIGRQLQQVLHGYVEQLLLLLLSQDLVCKSTWSTTRRPSGSAPQQYGRDEEYDERSHDDDLDMKPDVGICNHGSDLAPPDEVEALQSTAGLPKELQTSFLFDCKTHIVHFSSPALPST